MDKIPFDIKYRDLIERGKYSVIDSKGIAVKIVNWDYDGKYPILAKVGDKLLPSLYTVDGKPCKEYGVLNSNELYLIDNSPSALQATKAIFEQNVRIVLETARKKDIGYAGRVYKRLAHELLDAAKTVLANDIKFDMSNAPMWKRIKKGEQLPCEAYIWSIAFDQYAGSFEGRLIPNIANCTVGTNTWFLPVEVLRNLPKEP